MAFGILLTEESCATANKLNINPVDGKIRFPLTSMHEKEAIYLYTKEFKEPIMVLRKENVYHAFLMRCSHRGAELNYNGAFINCPVHGSVFDFNGNVTNAPATKPIRLFPVKLENDELVVTLS